MLFAHGHESRLTLAAVHVDACQVTLLVVAADIVEKVIQAINCPHAQDMEDKKFLKLVKLIARSMKRMLVRGALKMALSLKIQFINTRSVCIDIIEGSPLQGTGPRARNASPL